MLALKQKRVGRRLVSGIRAWRANTIAEEMMEKGILWRSNILTNLNNKVIDQHLIKSSCFLFGWVRDYNELTTANFHHYCSRFIPQATTEECAFADRFLNAPFYLTHATDSPEVVNQKNELILLSRKILQQKKITFAEEHTTNSDIIGLADDNYVFFHWK